MGCGIDRPSVTVSRWITVSVRETQKREEEGRRGERGGGGDRGIKPSPPPREPVPVFLSETGPYPGRKDLIPNAPPQPPQFTISSSPSSSSSRCPCLALSLSAAKGQ